MTSRHLKHLKFNLANRNLFSPLHDEPLNEWEMNLRFAYATYNFLEHVGRRYVQSSHETYTNLAQTPLTRTNLFFPKRGNPSLLTTEIVTSYLPTYFTRNYRGLELYEKFKEVFINPVSSFNFQLESDFLIDDEYQHLADLFHNGCDDVAWKTGLPKMLINANKSNEFVRRINRQKEGTI